MVDNAQPKRRLSSKSSTSRNENSEVRKLRNRMSQKAFRTRQAMRIKELEERLQGDSHPNTEWIRQLQDRNAALQGQLLDCHKKFISLQVSMKALAEASAQALGIESIDGNDERNMYRLCPRCQATQFQENEGNNESMPSLEPDNGQSDTTPGGDDDGPDGARGGDNDGSSNITIAGNTRIQLDDDIHLQLETEAKGQNTSGASANVEYTHEVAGKSAASDFSFSNEFQGNSGHVPALLAETGIIMPLNLTHYLTQSTGPEKFAALKDLAPFIAGHSALRRTNSAFSDHIDALEYCIGWNWPQRDIQALTERTATSIQSMLLTFVNLAWHSMTAWHTYTHAHIPLKALMAWRLNKNPDSYMAIVPSYRPTQLQMAAAHPSIIDWIPWASLRDKLIIHHSANPCLDELICDIGNSYVVPADLSVLVKCQQPIVGFVSVWDLVRAVAQEGPDHPSKPISEEFNSWQRPWNSMPSTEAFASDDLADVVTEGDFSDENLPASTPNALFSSRKLSMQAFKVLGMDRGASTFYLDPAFFERHPELYDSQSNLMAQGVALRPNKRVPMAAPTNLDSSVLGHYQEMSRILTSVAVSSTDADCLTMF